MPPMGKEHRERDQTPVDREVDWFFTNASPNPDRVGCPSDEALRELARRSRSISDPGYQHLSRCSPCYQQFRRYQANGSHHSNPRSKGKFLAVAAGILLIFAVTTFWWFARQRNRTMKVGAEIAVVDLRGFLVTRGAQIPSRRPIKLSRADVRTDILLPIGFEAGAYDLRLVDGSLATVLSAQVNATFENNVVTIHTAMALSDLHAGEYQLALRREGGEWHFFPATLE